MLPRLQEPILGKVKVHRIEEAFDSRNLLTSSALDQELPMINSPVSKSEKECLFDIENAKKYIYLMFRIQSL